MTYYCGIDLHSTNSVVVVIDGTDRVAFKGRLRNELRMIVDALAPYREALSGVVVESTYNWYWLARSLALGILLLNHREQERGFLKLVLIDRPLRLRVGLRHDSLEVVKGAKVAGLRNPL